jgi:LmbE family N-acetylglucosaminyl deacetylase
MHIYVSPHLDDAVLSCGATIARLTEASEDVLVVTVCAGAPTTLSPLASALHRKWGLETVEARRLEDIQACKLLGADFEHLEYQDAIYRIDAAGKPHYRRLRQLQGPGAEEDGVVLESVARTLVDLFARWPAARIHGPAAVGSHVDHALTRRAVEIAFGLLPENDGDRLLLYEDLPYGCRAEGSAADAPGREVLSACSKADWERKLSALESYPSQLDMLWPERDWARELYDHSARISPGSDCYVERSWVADRAGQPSPVDS